MKQVSTIIEIGTSKIVCIIAEKGQFGEAHILGSAFRNYPGYKNKKWIDKKSVFPAIFGALNDAEKQAGKKYRNVHVGIPADFIQVKCSRERVNFPKHKTLTQGDIARLYKSGRNRSVDETQSIMHVAPVNFKIDDARNTMEPVGQMASSVSATVSYISTMKSFAEAFEKAFSRRGYEVSTFIASSYATAMTFVSQEKRDNGAIVLDIGDKSTSIVITKGDGVIFHKALPFGGRNITNDLKNLLGIKFDMAEDLKKRSIYGLSLSEDDVYEVCDKETGKFERYSAIKVQEIIEARLLEMFEYISYYIENSRCNIPDYIPVFIAGGTASMRGIREFAQKQLSRNTIIVQPQSTKFNQPAFASALAVTDLALDALIENEVSFFDSIKIFFDK